MIDFSISNDEYLNDLMELVRPFESRSDENLSLAVEYENTDGVFKVRIASDKFDGFVKNYAFKIDTDGDLERKRVEKRYLKIAIYRTLSFLLNVNLPYGCLTGIRPTKLYCEIENDTDRCSKSAHDVFLKDYSVSDSKVELIERIVKVQKPIRNKSSRQYDVFVFIPFCPTRCAYCSFVSLPIDKQRKLVEPYVDCLVRELEQTKEIIAKKQDLLILFYKKCLSL